MTIRRAAAYTLIENDNQNAKTNDSQFLAIQTYCEQNGFDLVKVYADRTDTVTLGNRPEFQQMITNSGKNLFDVVIVISPVHFCQSSYDTIRYKLVLQANEVQLHIAAENLGRSPENAFLESLLEGTVKYHLENLSKAGNYELKVSELLLSSEFDESTIIKTMGQTADLLQKFFKTSVSKQQ